MKLPDGCIIYETRSSQLKRCSSHCGESPSSLFVLILCFVVVYFCVVIVSL
jgi:hypothetical protein